MQKPRTQEPQNREILRSKPNSLIKKLRVENCNERNIKTDASKPDLICKAELSRSVASTDAEVRITDYEGISDALYWKNGNGSVTFEGLYNLLLDYFPVASDTTAELEFKLYIDGNIAFKEFG